MNPRGLWMTPCVVSKKHLARSITPQVEQMCEYIQDYGCYGVVMTSQDSCHEQLGFNILYYNDRWTKTPSENCGRKAPLGISDEKLLHDELHGSK